jgi:hypothetical protein
MATAPNKSVTYGMIGLLALIVASMGGSMLLTEDQLNNAYICSTNQNVVIADHLSSTSKTAYWIDEANVSKSKTCTNGLWLNLKQYAKDNSIKINILLQNLNQEEIITRAESGKSYKCDQTKCIQIS